MKALSLTGLILISGFVAVVAGIVIGLCRGRFGPDPSSEGVLILIGGGMIMVAGVCCMVQVAKDIRTLHLPAKELAPSEAVLMETPHCIVHYRTGRPLRFWDAVGGKLVMTSHRLVFIAHHGQPWCYRIVLPLEEIARAEGTDEMRGFPGMLRVITVAGERELFAFGAIRELDANRWAAAILHARYRLNPEWGASDETSQGIGH